MRFGFYLPTRGPTATREGVLAPAREGERLGLRSAMIADHIVRSKATHPSLYAMTACPPGLHRDGTVGNTDIVLWHSFELHHLPRPEDHSVQPCVVCGFKLLPSGFFNQNPVIDLPRTTNAASCCG